MINLFFQSLGVKAVADIRDNQLIGEYVGGVEFADDFKFANNNDVMDLLDAEYPSKGRYIVSRWTFTSSLSLNLSVKIA